MARSSTRISLVERPVNQPIEQHRRGTGEYHTENNQAHDSQRRPAICRYHQRAQSKRQRKNCMRKTDQLQKSRQRPAQSELLTLWMLPVHTVVRVVPTTCASLVVRLSSFDPQIYTDCTDFLKQVKT